MNLASSMRGYKNYFKINPKKVERKIKHKFSEIKKINIY